MGKDTIAYAYTAAGAKKTTTENDVVINHNGTSYTI